MNQLQIRLDLPRADNFMLRVNSDIPLQSVTGVYGPSGSGKTSLLDCLAGLQRATQDSKVCLGDTVWQEQDCWVPAHQRRVGYVFQDARLFPHLSIAGNLDFAIKRRPAGTGPDRQQLCEWMQLQDLLNRYPQQLSRGQQQRVAIARALLSAPQLLLLDEPLANIDKRARRDILQQLQTIHRELATPMIYVSHEMDELAQLADWLLVLDQGEVVAEGSVLELSSSLQLALAHEEQAAAIVNAEVVAQDSEYGLTELSLEGQALFVTATPAAPGESMRLQVPARDVSLCLQAPQQTSILNIFQVRIDSIDAGDDSRALVRLQLGEQFLLSRLTRKSIASLGLQAGDKVYAQVKSVALLRDGP
ncbi:MAG: molybdenum ABC transporter ATP-binding protein [Halieaceae bacterium]